MLMLPARCRRDASTNVNMHVTSRNFDVIDTSLESVFLGKRTLVDNSIVQSLISTF